MEIKIKKKTYTITKEDRFMETRWCIVLLTQGDSPMLTSRTISKFKRINVVPGAVKNISTFSIEP